MRRNKHGNTSIFLAIILSAVIFVEGLYLAAIIDADRRVNINRGLRLQVEQILASYDEELFLEYGIYGFFEENISQEVFRKVIEESGYTYGGDIYIDGYKTISTLQLEDAISNYYTYRTAGIILKDLSGVISMITDELEEFEFFDKINRFKASGGNSVLNILNKGASVINEVLESDELSGLVDLEDEDLGLISDLFDYLEEINDSELVFDDDFSPEDMFSMNFYNDLINFAKKSSEVIEDDFYNLFVAHYAVYHFEAVVKEYEVEGDMYPDTTLRGTDYRDINPYECTDMEYIISGYEGGLGVYTVGHVISGFIMLSEAVNLLLDKDFMKVVNKIAKILSAVLKVLLDGAEIPPFVFVIMILIYSSTVLMIRDMFKIYKGKTVEVFKIKNAPEPFNEGFSMNYKDFAFYFAFVAGKGMDKRIINVLENKYGPIMTKISLGTQYRDDVYSVKAGYDLYGL
ncbi:MAG: hypothetical protein J6U23_10510 [Clostridiales bacterium]|nr:hypothetical protein [Clostridiales bacterium]